MTVERTTSSDGYGDAVVALVSVVRERLLGGGFDHHGELLTSRGDADVVRPGDAASAPPVLRHLDVAVDAAAEHGPGEAAEVVRVLASRAPWTRTAGYVSDPPNSGFLDGYAHATLAGTPDGQGEAADGGVGIGLLLLAPGVHYPAHHHPADEVYLPLTPARWLGEDGRSYDPRPAGAPIHHRPWQPHGMVTGALPLLAVYLWSGDVASSSRFC